jgi:hypothetical protein
VAVDVAYDDRGIVDLASQPGCDFEAPGSLCG